MEKIINWLMAVPEIAPREGDGRRDNRPAKVRPTVDGPALSLRRRRIVAKQRQEAGR